MPPSVDIRFAVFTLANADHFLLLTSVIALFLYNAVSHTGGLAALGADQHDVGGVDGALLLVNAARLALPAGLLVLQLCCCNETSRELESKLNALEGVKAQLVDLSD